MRRILLYNSSICRLCADEDENGELLFTSENDEPDLSSMVNRYLPLKITDDGKLPRTICADCNVQMEATVQFFEIIVKGQQKIRDLYELQVERHKTSGNDNVQEAVTNDVLTYVELEEDPLALPITTENVPNDSIYADNHETVLRTGGLDKPKKRCGRPSKQSVEVDSDKIKKESTHFDSQDGEVEEIGIDGKQKRKRKRPQRLSGIVSGKELERIPQVEGVTDKEEDDSNEKLNENTDKQITVACETVIGYLETKEGENLNELVVMRRGRGRPKLKEKRPKHICNICDCEFFSISQYQIHRKSHKTVSDEGSECQKQLPSEDVLKLHQRQTEYSDELIIKEEPLDPCGKIPENKELNEKDVSTGVNRESSNQPPSSQESTENSTSPIKNSTANSNLAIFRCDNCSQEFKTNEACAKHMQYHSFGKALTCAICMETFDHPSSFVTHIAIHESTKSDKGYPCNICGKVMNHRSSVIYHKGTEHNNGRRFVCNKCGKSFKHKQLLQQHQMVHSEERPYACEFCDARFKTKVNLISHSAKHTGEKKYSCDICKQQFAYKTSLSLHYRWHMGHKPYSCDVCQKTFSQNGNLREHMRIHTGEKPYTCLECEKIFRTSSQFKIHVRRHTGERPWKCDICTKAFFYKDNWKCHIDRHNGVSPRARTRSKHRNKNNKTDKT